MPQHLPEINLIYGITYYTIASGVLLLFSLFENFETQMPIFSLRMYAFEDKTEI